MFGWEMHFVGDFVYWSLIIKYLHTKPWRFVIFKGNNVLSSKFDLMSTHHSLQFVI